jgi:hypothetical protein
LRGGGGAGGRMGSAAEKDGTNSAASADGRGTMPAMDSASSACGALAWLPGRAGGCIAVEFERGRAGEGAHNVRKMRAI